MAAEQNKNGSRRVADYNATVDKMLESTPGVRVVLRPIAPPAALGLAGFAGSTWIVATYMANWSVG
jgi:succinate-acetate transporter protein